MLELNKRSNEDNTIFDTPFMTAKGVASFLANYHYFHTAALDKGDMDAVILMSDFNEIFSKVIITTKQYEALYLVFYKGLNQREASEEMNCSKQAVQQLIHSSTTKISESYKIQMNNIRKEDTI